MRQLTCKSLSILFLNIFFVVSTVLAQDTTETSKRQPAQPKQPGKAVTPPAVKASATQTSAPVRATAAPKTNVPVDNTLLGQYEALLKNSWMQQGYKVVNPTKLTTLWKSVNDSLNQQKQQLADAKRKIEEQQKQLSGLKVEPGSQPAAQEQKAVTVNQIEVLGMAVDVPTYNWIVWGTIILLALGLAGVLFSTTKNSMDSKQYKLQYEEISSEYQTYKTKAKEKEMRLARELQTERNTIEELLAKKNEEAAARRGKK